MLDHAIRPAHGTTGAMITSGVAVVLATVVAKRACREHVKMSGLRSTSNVRSGACPVGGVGEQGSSTPSIGLLRSGLIPTRTERHALAQSRRPMGMTRYSLRSENPGMSQPSRGLV